MEDLIASIFDKPFATDQQQPGPSTSKKAFESVQSRFERLQVPRSEVEWMVCGECGDVINQKLYEDHILQHDIAHLLYQMYHYELAEEARHKELVERVQRKEAKAAAAAAHHHRRSRSSSTSSSTSTSNSSSPGSPPLSTGLNSSNSTSSSAASSRQQTPLPDQMDFSGAEIGQKKKRGLKRKADKQLKEMGVRKKRSDAGVKKGKRIGFVVGKKQRKMGGSGGNGKAFRKAQYKPRPPQAKIDLAPRAMFEHNLCLKYLGPQYMNVFVDLRKQPQLCCDRKGRVKVPNVQSPQKLRRSLRGAIKEEFNDDENVELVALL